MLERLRSRYDDGAIISVDPYMPDGSGEILRWIVQVDGVEVPDIDVRVVEGADVVVMLLVHEGEEVEVCHWAGDPTSPHPAGAPYYAGSPARVMWSLGELMRYHERKGSSSRDE